MIYIPPPPCIYFSTTDEFDGVRESDRAALHEAMEQQTCSVAKAGMVTTLRTRASVFGTCNPSGHRRYNPKRPLTEQLNISGPLLSRFDIVLLLLDDINPIWDEQVADHILKTHSNSAASTPGSLLKDLIKPSSTSAASVFSDINVLQQYIQWVKTRFHPTMTPESEEILSGYYHLRRFAHGRHAARTTLRLLESLVRVSQAHARLMARDRVLKQDAVMAVALIDSSAVDGESVLTVAELSGASLSAPGDQFWENPDEEYEKLERMVVGAIRNAGLGGGGTRELPWHDPR